MVKKQEEYQEGRGGEEERVRGGGDKREGGEYNTCNLFLTEDVHACKKNYEKYENKYNRLANTTVWQNKLRGTRGTMGRAFL